MPRNGRRLTALIVIVALSAHIPVRNVGKIKGGLYRSAVVTDKTIVRKQAQKLFCRRFSLVDRHLCRRDQITASD